MAGISLHNIFKRYPKGAEALHDVTFEVGEHEVVTIVGPSGCGKSTLLRIVAGLEPLTSGVVEIGGRPVTNVPARERNIAMVFQSYALYPHMTCFENLALNLRLKKVREREIEDRVRETARLLDIEELLDKKPKELSGGQRQRVAVGRALIRKPDAFLFDEPLSNLDALLRERVRHDLRELFRSIRATVLYVTHDQVEAMTLADRVVVLNQGLVQQIGHPEELYRRPANRFVASFIGSPAMNLFEAKLTEGVFRIGTSEVQSGVAWSGEAVVGIRPEHLAIGDTGIAARMKWVENLGAHYLIGVDVGDVTLTLTSLRKPVSDTVSLEFHREDLHVFEKGSGKNLSLVLPRANTHLQSSRP